MRSKEKAKLVAESVKTARFVYGDLDDFELLETEAAKANIICHWAACEHLRSAQALVSGLQKTSNEKPGYLIHTSGSDILSYPDLDNHQYGAGGAKIFDDLDGLDDILNIKKTAPHREVDMTVLLADESKGKTAIGCPPTIFGLGRGPGNRRSVQVPQLVAGTLQRGAAYTVEEGRNIWSIVHIHDLSSLFLKLVEAAVGGAGSATWGRNGFYFAENGEVMWRDVADEVARAAKDQGLIKASEVEFASAEEADRLWSDASYLIGTNPRCKALRARELLQWSCSGPHLYDTIPALVEQEARTSKQSE